MNIDAYDSWILDQHGASEIEGLRDPTNAGVELLRLPPSSHIWRETSGEFVAIRPCEDGPGDAEIVLRDTDGSIHTVRLDGRDVERARSLPLAPGVPVVVYGVHRITSSLRIAIREQTPAPRPGDGDRPNLAELRVAKFWTPVES